MKVGGPADIFFIATSKADLIDAVQSAIKHKIPYTVLGAASNVLIKDGGVRGLVIKNRADAISLAGFKGKVTASKAGVQSALVKAESGAIMNQLVRFCIDQSLAGLEEFLGIPGTVGGAVYNNSHHLDHLIGDYVATITVLDKHGRIKTYQQSELNFSYDYSILQKTQDTILDITFMLTAGNKQELWSRAEAALARRRDTQPLEIPSSGCMFKNIGQANAIRFNTPNHSTAAGFLIDRAGLKGSQVGGAQVSTKHANFLVNTGAATASDIITLSNQIKQTVKEKYGLELQEEVFVIGED